MYLPPSEAPQDQVSVASVLHRHMINSMLVGNALRNNPFAPYIPCHRVIASNHFIGGFFGEWGRAHKTGTRCDQKLQLLKSEGVEFNVGGYLKDLDLIWIQSPD